ncbi:hypothetical protein [Ralstonia sp. SET104]|uniref:hypothetical protein n=1 Tax=Ralstonia sp. SET104 TaxID=2448774 RepID=UPI000F58E6DF|nr:hypothetical protein [Ralstonia sp. SET104]GCB03575.1 hypothetical protein PSUB009319_12060 [Ralstonia sp. SET104]
MSLGKCYEALQSSVAVAQIREAMICYAVMLPLMLASVVAYVIARSIDQTSMYEITAKRHREATARLRLRATQMRDLIKPADTVLLLTAGFAEISMMFLEYPVKYLYVVDAHHRYPRRY